MIETFPLALPHGITLSCRAAGERGRPLVVFLHGFPEAAFIWDPFLEHFAARGYRCVAPNLRGFEKSSRPAEVEAYRSKYLLQDLAALVDAEGGRCELLVAHDWGGAVAWLAANQMPARIARLAIINSPHAGTFQRELAANPKQQQASAYMNFLIRPDAEAILREDGCRRLFEFFTRWGGAPWLTEPLKAQYRAVWEESLEGGCNYYRASPLRPPRPGDPGAAAVQLPPSTLTVDIPTLVIWAMDDVALPPELLDGLEAYVPRMTLVKVPGATHWIIHERPDFVMERLAAFLQ